MQATNASHESAEVYEVTRHMILLKYEHQTSSKHYISQEDSFIRNAWPTYDRTLPNDKSNKKYQHFQVINQIWGMQVSATIHVLHCTRSRDNLHLIYTMEKQANNYHKTRTRNTKFAIYRGANKSLARPRKKEATATETYKTIPTLTAYKQLEYIGVLCTP